MPSNKHSQFGNTSYPKARPFDEFLIGNPTGNPDFVIYSSGSFGYSPQQHQQYGYQSNPILGTLPQTILQPTTTHYPTVFAK